MLLVFNSFRTLLSKLPTTSRVSAPDTSGQGVLVVCVTRPYRTYTAFNFSIHLRYVRAGFSLVLLLSLSRPKRRDKDRQLIVYSKARLCLPGGRQVRSAGTRYCERSEAELNSDISMRICSRPSRTRRSGAL